MKISKNQLRELVKEQIEEILECGMPPEEEMMAHGYMGGMHGETINEPTGMHGYEQTMNEPTGMEDDIDNLEEPIMLVASSGGNKDPDGYEGSMAKNNLRNAILDANMLGSMIVDDENLEPWVQEKIAVASSMLNSVARYMRGGRTG